MTLPSRFDRTVARDKIVHYLLNLDHEVGALKARFFLSFGFSPEQWPRMPQL